jgi:hypothetical protein
MLFVGQMYYKNRDFCPLYRLLFADWGWGMNNKKQKTRKMINFAPIKK